MCVWERKAGGREYMYAEVKCGCNTSAMCPHCYAKCHCVHVPCVHYTSFSLHMYSYVHACGCTTTVPSPKSMHATCMYVYNICFPVFTLHVLLRGVCTCSIAMCTLVSTRNLKVHAMVSFPAWASRTLVLLQLRKMLISSISSI